MVRSAKCYQGPSSEVSKVRGDDRWCWQPGSPPRTSEVITQMDYTREVIQHRMGLFRTFSKSFAVKTTQNRTRAAEMGRVRFVLLCLEFAF